MLKITSILTFINKNIIGKNHKLLNLSKTQKAAIIILYISIKNLLILRIMTLIFCILRSSLTA